MERLYTVTLLFNPNTPFSSERKFGDYLLSLGLFIPDEPFIAGTHFFARTKDNGYVDINHGLSMLHSIKVGSAICLEELEAIKYALTITKQLESATPSFNPPLAFNPNLIYLFVGPDSEWSYNIQVENFLPNAKELQRRLYKGGNTAYGQSSGHFGIYLGVEDELNKYDIKVIEVEGIAKPANSLDDLLIRLEQK